MGNWAPRETWKDKLPAFLPPLPLCGGLHGLLGLMLWFA